MFYYKYDDFTKDIDRFHTILGSYKPDIIVAIARGGVTFGHFLSEKLNIRSLFTLNSIHYNDKMKLDHIQLFNIPEIPANTNVLVVDDIVDSGDTMQEVIAILKKRFPQSDFKSGVLFYKKSASYIPDYKVHEAHDWIHFFWNIH
jgi:xanthine phosphoribosyltransferase